MMQKVLYGAKKLTRGKYANWIGTPLFRMHW